MSYHSSHAAGKRKQPLLILLLLVLHTLVQAQKPGGLSNGLTAWFKANTTTTGNLVTIGVNNSVSTWKSDVNTLTLAQATTSKQPSWQAGTTTSGNFNFNPFIQFNTAAITNLYNTSSTPDLLGTNGTVFLVVNTFAGSSVNPTALTYMSSSSYRFQVKPGFRIQTGANGVGYTADHNTPLMPLTAPATAGFILTSKGTGASFRGRKNADSIPLTHLNDAVYNPAVATGFYLGSNGTSSEPYNGGIAEVITFNTPLSDANMNKVESYLAIKYGITLSKQSAYGPVNSNYTSADGTVLWNAATNSTYHNRITGIGRDDSSALLQKQSRSVHDQSMLYIYNGDTGGTFPVSNKDNATTITDKSFLLAGDNNLGKTLAACAGNGTIVRMARVWKVQKTGTGISTVTIAVDKDSIPVTATHLLVSPDPSFATTAITYPLTLANGKRYATVTLNNNDYFTFSAGALQITLTPTPLSCAPNSGGINAIVTGGLAPLTYLWSPTGQTTPNLTQAPAGTYTLTVMQGSCQVNAQATIEKLVPVASPIAQVTAIGVNSVSFSWTPVPGATGYKVAVNNGPYITPSSGNSGTTHTVTGLTPLQTVMLQVIALGVQSCQNSTPDTAAAKTLTDQLFIPNAFTPDGNGLNDVFNVYGNVIAGMDMKVFNQWGELLFAGNNISHGWDGTYKGKKQPSGVYTYIIHFKLTDGSELTRKGFVNLLR